MALSGTVRPQTDIVCPFSVNARADLAGVLRVSALVRLFALLIAAGHCTPAQWLYTPAGRRCTLHSTVHKSQFGRSTEREQGGRLSLLAGERTK